MKASSQEVSTATFIAYTEPSQHKLGHDARTGEVLSYPIDRIVAMAHPDESGKSHHVGQAEIEGAAARELQLPREVGLRIMGIMENRGLMNCHGFANRMSGREERRNTPAGSVIRGNEADGLQPGETGLIGSPSTAYRAGGTGIQLDPGEALHSVVGISPDSDDIIHVDTLLADPSIANLQDVVGQYARLTGAADTAVYHVPPPRDYAAESTEINIYDPFGTNG